MRLISAILALFLAATAAWALGEPHTLLSGVEATGAGAPAGLTGSTFTAAVEFTNSGGSVTALTVAIEGSLDGTKWFALATHTLTAGELSAGQAMFHITNKYVRFVRANITTLTETGTTAVTVKISPEAY